MPALKGNDEIEVKKIRNLLKKAGLAK